MQHAAAGQPKLGEARPDLIASVHPTRNAGDLLPEDISLGSARRIWWICREGQCGHTHEWESRIHVRKRSGCPICARKQPCVCNSLAAVHPELAQQWDADANAPLGPKDLLPGSNKPVGWVCAKHPVPVRWVARVKSRTKPRRPTGCPACFRERQSLLKTLGTAPAAAAAATAT